MVPRLSRVVENSSIARLVCTQGDRLERLAFVGRAFDRGIQFVDIALVMLAMMKLKGFRGNLRLQRISCIRKIWKLNGHSSLLQIRVYNVSMLSHHSYERRD